MRRSSPAAGCGRIRSSGANTREVSLSYATRAVPVSVTYVPIRGAASDQTVVVIDGVKADDPSLTGRRLTISRASLMVGDIQRIEILRGAQSTLWGSQAIGGVVKYRYRRCPTKPFEVSVDAERAVPTAPVTGAPASAAEVIASRGASAGGYYHHRPASPHSPVRSGSTDGTQNASASGQVHVDITRRRIGRHSRHRLHPRTHRRIRRRISSPPLFNFAVAKEYGITKEFNNRLRRFEFRSLGRPVGKTAFPSVTRITTARISIPPRR